jgi:guanylate kinase
MNKPLFLFVGKSASGKTTVANILESVGKYTQLQSYTTRIKRTEDEVGHTFITDEELDNLENIIAYTEYNNFRYCATAEQIDAADIYVIDVPGVETLLEKYETERPIVVFYFDATVKTRIDRMLNRHDHDAAIVSRLHNDEASDWEDELSKLVWHYKNNCDKNVELNIIDANQNIDNVLVQVKTYIENMEGVQNDNCD